MNRYPAMPCTHYELLRSAGHCFCVVKYEKSYICAYVMASLFLEVLHEPEFENAFRKIVFAIIDDGNSKRNYDPFCRIIH